MFIGPFEHHSNELPWRESIADVVDDPRGRRRPHRPGRAARPSWSRYADRPLKIGSFSAASNVTGIVTDTDAIATLLHAPRRAVVLGLRGRRAVRRRSRWTGADAGDPLATRTPSSCRPHKFIGGPGTPGVLVVRRDLLRNRVPDRARRRHGRVRQPREHVYLDDPEHREEGGTPAIVESIRAGLVFQLKQAVGTDVIQRARGALAAPGGRRLARQPAIEILGNLDAERLSIVSFVVQRAAAAATCTTTSSSRCSTTCSASSPGAAAPAPARTAIACSASTSERSHAFEREITRRLRGHQARLGAGQLQLLRLRRGRRLHRRRRRPGRRATAGACCPTTGSTRAPGSGGTGAGRSSRRCAWRTSSTTATAAWSSRAGASAFRSRRCDDTCSRRGRSSPRRRLRPWSVSRHPACRPRSRSCCGSSSPTSA